MERYKMDEMQRFLSPTLVALQWSRLWRPVCSPDQIYSLFLILFQKKSYEMCAYLRWKLIIMTKVELLVFQVRLADAACL